MGFLAPWSMLHCSQHACTSVCYQIRKSIRRQLCVFPDCRSHAYLSELNKRDSAAVIKYVDSGSTAVNSAVIVEYLKALVKTGAIAQFSDGGNVRYMSNLSRFPLNWSDLPASNVSCCSCAACLCLEPSCKHVRAATIQACSFRVQSTSACTVAFLS